MPLPAAALRYPYKRVLLQRTRLAYVHLQNLLTDAKRDRAARVYGYVLVWLPEELLLFYLQEGEVVNATASADGRRFRALPIAGALAKVPSAAEVGEICFHECDDEQLATMYWSQVLEPVAWPAGLNVHDAGAVGEFLHAIVHDGVVEVCADGGLNYAVVRDGRPLRAFFADPATRDVQSGFATLLESSPGHEYHRPRLWPVPPPLPVQAPPALIRAYRELVEGVVERLVALGATSAPAVAEHARRLLSEDHVALKHFAAADPNPADPVTETPALSAAIGAWLGDLLLTTAPPDGASPGRLIGEVAYERRHVFQSAGLFEALPWKVV
ncbi:MAG TPA: hypothetical protein VHE78_12305 [Gemmatimonadaceae bacterium]|nr:hypothetical protein [Gemmatimonadaceae bacterium]